MLYDEDIKAKEQIVEDAKLVLKREFVGIDDIIDGVMENVRTWYMFPNLYNRPLIINLFGMTGVGKTSLVQRISQLLDLEKDYYYFNFGEISECTAWDIEERINDEISDEKSNRVFVYDEFQYASTIAEDGTEREKRSGLKPFWELMDAGKMHKRDSVYLYSSLFSTANYLIRINNVCRIQLENGAWVNRDECLSHFGEYEISRFSTVLNTRGASGAPTERPNAIGKIEADGMGSNLPNNMPSKGSMQSFILTADTFSTIVRRSRRSRRDTDSYIELFNEFCTYDIDQLIARIVDVYNMACKGFDLDFHNSLIFVLANLDEAYNMTFNLNPDMSADTFHKMTKNISIVNIKKALQKRFRNEQIARLGNIHFIYPSLSSKTYREIIRRNLDKFTVEFRTMTGIEASYDKKIVDLIYKDSVFPTQGTRPVFSTIYDFVNSKVSNIIIDIYDTGITAQSVHFTASGRMTKVVVTSGDCQGKKVFKYKNVIRVDSLRDTKKDTQQAIVALHESGHFVTYLLTFGKTPEKLVSRTANDGDGGFMQHFADDDVSSFTKIGLKRHLIVLLGGYAAEKMFFGDDHMTGGACSDLESATKLAVRMVREYGMGSFKFTSTTMSSPMHERMILLDHDRKKHVDDEVNRLIEGAYSEACEYLDKWRSILKESAEYLCTHSSMPKEIMEKLFKKIPAEAIGENFDRQFYMDMIHKI